MEQYVCENRVDMVVICELYKQLSYWYNDTVGDASLCVTLFNEKQAIGGTKISKRGVVGIRVENTMCISGYCSPNTSKQEFASYIAELEATIREGMKRVSAMMVAGDFNSKSTVWGGRRSEQKGIYLLDALTFGHT